MRTWMNKATGDLVLALPHWEPLKIQFDEKFYADLDPSVKKMIGKRKVAHGLMVQVGWLIQNKNGCWFGLPLSIDKQFEDMGEVE